MKAVKFSILMITFFISTCLLIQNSFAQEEEENIIGFVKTTEWADDGEAIDAVLVVEFEEEDEEGNIETYEEEYQIEKDEIGKELIKLDGKKVEVFGIINEDTDENESTYIVVQSFIVIEEEE